MSHQIKKTSNRKHRTSCFLGCFGFLVKDDEEKKISGGVSGGGGKDEYGGRRISRYWFRRMKKPSAKTVPVNVVSKFAPKLRSSKEIHVLDKDMNMYATSDHPPAAAGTNLNMVMAAEPDQVGIHKSSEAMTDDNGEHIILEKIKSLGGENGTIRYHVSRSKTSQQLSKSVAGQGIYGRGSNENDAKFGSLVAISILVAILGIMLIWGKLCAILCTAICFYIITSFRTQQENEFDMKRDSSKEFDESNFKEYNKKVVFQGFLERSNQCK
ncbi:uncharacterized protein At5g23160-like [Olea europaea var. sylvestris]|uniref:uncharacterized protein At5g23160-like n=1 Tax=Olea europaea var. sylvestris TaxID=158386 RepID=UPI000C1CDB29|nr:uncharacterized protein At5g23160-like [Olea europaea var. sylvestris]